MIKKASISNCGKYRYQLIRIWDRKKYYCAFIMLNPSTADAVQDDATLRRCINFAKAWGYGGIFVYNLFAYRSKNRKVLKHVKDPIGPLNDKYLLQSLVNPGIASIVCAWGNDGKYLNRNYEVFELLGKDSLKCIEITKQGQPGHPLYIKGNVIPRDCDVCM